MKLYIYEFAHIVKSIIYLIDILFMNNLMNRKIALITNLKEIDRLARLYVLEGVMGVTPSTLIRNINQGFLKVQEKYPDLSPEWLNRGESMLIRSSLKGLDSIANQTSKSAEDFLMEALAFPRSKKTDQNKLYYLGETNREEILTGNMTPQAVGQKFSVFLKRKALTLQQFEKGKRYIPRDNFDGEGQREEVFEKPSSGYDKSSLLISLLTDASHPLSKKVYDRIDQIIDEYPFESVEEDPDVPKKIIDFIKAFARKNPRISTSEMKVQMLNYLSANASPRNQQIFEELEEVDEEIVAEFATQTGMDPDLRRDAYKTWVEVARDPGDLDPLLRRRTEFKENPEAFWGKRLQKANAEVARILGFRPNDATMTRLLGVGGRNVMTFIEKVVSQDTQIKRILAEMEVALEGDYSKSHLGRTAKLKKRILKLASRNPKKFLKLLKGF